jgi:hypothetical protein
VDAVREELEQLPQKEPVAEKQRGGKGRVGMLKRRKRRWKR